MIDLSYYEDDFLDSEEAEEHFHKMTHKAKSVRKNRESAIKQKRKQKQRERELQCQESL
jgi:hypothetical protein